MKKKARPTAPKFRGHTPRHGLPTRHGYGEDRRHRTVRMIAPLDDELTAQSDRLGITVSDAIRLLCAMHGERMGAVLADELAKVWAREVSA